jgi:hypothetical protein
MSSQNDYSSTSLRSQWQPIEVDVVGYHIVDTIEGAVSGIDPLGTARKLPES